MARRVDEKACVNYLYPFALAYPVLIQIFKLSVHALNDILIQISLHV